MTDTNQRLRDLGFGARVIQETTQRLLNRDGTFNVERQGRGWAQSMNVHHLFISMSWTRFNLMLLAIYGVITIGFAAGYLACGSGAITDGTGNVTGNRVLDSLYFSVHTFTTVRYGNLIAHGFPANLLVAIESFIGMSGIAVAAGLIFARVSTPRPKILFSEKAIIEVSNQPSPSDDKGRHAPRPTRIPDPGSRSRRYPRPRYSHAIVLRGWRHRVGQAICRYIQSQDGRQHRDRPPLIEYNGTGRCPTRRRIYLVGYMIAVI